MHTRKTWTARRRLVAFGSAAVVLALAAGALMYRADAELLSALRDSSSLGEAMRNHSAAELARERVQRSVHAALSVEDTGSPLEAILTSINGHSAALGAAIARNAALELPVRAREALAGVGQPLSEYQSAASEFVDTVTFDRVRALSLVRLLDQKLERLTGAMETAGDRLEVELRNVAENTEGISNAAFLVLSMAIVSVCALITAIVALILEPYKRQLDTITALSDGNTDVQIESVSRADEIGDMWRAIDAFRQTIIDSRTHEGEARKALQLIVEERRQKEAQDKHYIDAHNVFLTTFTEALRKLSSGDLDWRLEQPYAIEYESIREAFNEAAEKIREAVFVIVRNSNQINRETEDIVAVSDDLARHTEEQASSLEETAASIEELAATVRQNANNAHQASEVAASAHEMASSGGRLASNAVCAMDRIEESSRRIHEIVVLIEEIAFQTNILALNAAVEAARAGDAGRGFAVVANEVRALSQRSAQALKDVKSLIANSTQSIGEGVGLVKEAGTSLTEIVIAVKKVADHISEIAAASSEQATGIDQVSKAISSMDQMTQENAALVQQTNSALISAKTQIDGLRKAVSIFNARQLELEAVPVNARTFLHTQRHELERKVKATARRAGAATAAAADADWQHF